MATGRHQVAEPEFGPEGVEPLNRATKIVLVILTAVVVLSLVLETCMVPPP